MSKNRTFFEIQARHYPNQAYKQNPEQYWEYFHKRFPVLSWEDMIDMLQLAKEIDLKPRRNMKSLFIPLKKEFFKQFKKGTKTHEYRLFGKRWNKHTCFPGRPVILSSGYSGQRLFGIIQSVKVVVNARHLPGWIECYGPSGKAGHPAIVIEITTLK